MLLLMLMLLFRRGRRRRGAFVVEGAEFVLLGFEVVIGVSADLAIGTGFVCATMSGKELS